ncbi:Sel1 domain protein repeat-containing protein [Syntrophobotulus glycolicus DSM 8271]|uniref:Sel1 domain protein repeat-containing protein n=1 Tax=Syntrophobotulus glycolicus (strain DSM 8271 / FlGlyR) TaxID=645991 RepID=F0SUZ0_SYNGF|nr:MobP3 family relaxase [Syntrophobotulus glycolicus]ADY54411.1 Sel1 domain protein repeat-containing protein [Syntrophobotulus glycolicus DSM 8271]
MARIILKCPYLKGGEKTAAHLSNLVKYIATRDGVEKMESGHKLWHSTKKQKDLIAQILREFPDAKELFEYEDYLENSNRGNASEFITIALERHLDKISGREKYLDYIANRPRVEKFDSHGLFTAGDDPLVLSQVADEVANHTGNVWTPIISLRREDAAQMGYDNVLAWKALLSEKAVEIAENMKIHPDHLKWYAAFHNESHHPHIHMVCYSTDPREGYLTKQGIKKMKSSLANEIFRQELIPLYGEKTQRRDDLKEQAAESMREMIRQMKGGVLQSGRMEQLITHLAERLQNTSGKKQYGYLKADLKNVVDEIVDELAKDSRIAEAYRLWWEVRGRIESIYTETPSEPPPLSRCDDFKPIRNMVIQEALLIGSMTFEEPASVETALPESEDDLEMPSSDMADEEDQEPADDSGERSSSDEASADKESSDSWWTDGYKQAKQYLYGDEDAGILQDFEKAHELFLMEAEADNPLALCDLGRMSADGLGCEADADEAYRWYEKALAVFHAAEEEKPWKYTEYRIGKMYAAGLGTEQDYLQAADWLTLSADENYKYAQYSLGGLYYHGKGVDQDHESAFALYTRSADQSFPYASFELGKMLRDGIGCVKNQQDSDRRFKEAFLGFVSLEEQGHDDKLQYRLGWMLLNGVGTDKDEARAKEYFEKAAFVGNPFAYHQLAKLILSDEKAPQQDVEKALGYLKKAVEAENPYAAYFLGKLYEKGQHVPQNIAEAIRLYTLSAGQDNDFAAYRLGKLYLGGEGVLKDVESAIRWMTFAADRKNQFAEYALGVLYFKGEDVPKDVPKALEYLKRSAGQGNQFAQYRLGKIYLMGEDVPKDIQTALQFLTAAAEQGNQYAQYTLGKLYLMGKDVPKDKETAVRWFTLSAAQGNIYAQFFLAHIDDFKDPSVLLAGTRLLHHMSRVFADNAPPLKPPGQRTDRKLLRKLREKKQAQGHARDDHEQTMSL